MKNIHLSHLTLVIALGAVLCATSLLAASKAEEEQQQISILKADGPLFDKDVACRRLAVIGTKESVPALATLLTHERLSHLARVALEKIPDASADDALRAALGKTQGRLLVGVLGSVGNRQDAKAVSQIVALLGNADDEVAAAAAFALGKISGATASQALQDALAKAPEKRVSALAEGSFWCAKNLAAHGKKEAAISLYGFVRQANVPKYIAAAAARNLVLLQGQDGAALLGEMVRSNEQEMLNAALLAAREVPGAKITKALMSELDKLPGAQQALVLAVLGDRRDPVALPVVRDLAKRGESAARVAALKVLGQMGDASVVPVLFDAATDADSVVSKAASETLAVLPGKEADTAIAEMVSKGGERSRQAAIEAVAQRRVTLANAAMVTIVAGENAVLTKAALKALNETGSANEVPGLLACLLKTGDKSLMEAVEVCIQNIATRISDKAPLARQFLTPLATADLLHKNSLLRLLASAGGSDALKAVKLASQDANAEIQMVGFRSLCDWPDLEAAPDLLELARNAPQASRKILALRGFIRLAGSTDVAADKKLAMCKDAASLAQRNEEKKLLLGALGTVASLDALNMALSYLEVNATKAEACLAAVSIGEQLVGKQPAQVSGAMKKVQKATEDRRLKRRIQSLLDQTTKN
ncbi:MAG: HEAT repeat domain-containing protein [Verrucomicrobiota bacterium]